MAEKISVQIGLEGADEVKKQLADIGATSTKAFDAAGDASQGAAGEIEKVAEASDKVKQSFNQVAQESLKTATAVADLVGTIAKYGVEIGLAVTRNKGLISSLMGLTGPASTAARALGLLTPQFALLGTGAGAAVLSIAKVAVALEVAEKAATKFAASDEKLNNTLQTLAATSGKSFDELQRGEAAFGQIGISAETFRSSVGKISETLEGADVKNLTRGMTDIVELVKQIAAGEKGIKFADWVTAEDKVKGVAIAMKQAADAGKNATQVMLEFLRSADLATAIKVGAAFGLSEADVDRVRRFNGEISDLVKRIGGAGVLISPEAAANFDKMRTSIQNVDSAWARLKQSLASTAFSSLAASFSATMNSMEAAAVNGVARIVESLNQAVRAMATPPPAFTATLTAIGQQLQNAVTGLNSVVANIVGAVMRRAGASEASIKAVQDQINGVTQAAQQSGQTAQQGVQIWTQWGTAAGGAANTAKAGVQEGVQIWTQWGTAAGGAGEKAAAGLAPVAPAVQSGSDKVAEFISQVTGISWDSISSAGVAAWDALTGAIQTAINKVLEFIGLKPKGPAAAAGAPGKARGGLLGGRGTGTSDSNLAWVSRGEYIMPARAVRQPGVLSFLEALRRPGRIPGFAGGGAVGDPVSLAGSISGILKEADVELIRAFNAINDAMITLHRSLDAAFKTVDQSMLRVQNMLDSVHRVLRNLYSNPKGPAFAARGGLLGGRGTGTSDSNLAWVSRGEHIMPARAVAQPGVLALLEALRRSGGDLSRVLDGMGRFALGGMIPRAIPAFAAGGLAGGMSNVTIQFPGLPPISGLRASSNVVDQLHKAAALAQVRSGGRKPSRYS